MKITAKMMMLVQIGLFLVSAFGLENPRPYHIMVILILVSGAFIPVAIRHSMMNYLAILTGVTFTGATVGIVVGMIEAPEMTWWCFVGLAYTMLALGIAQVLVHLHDRQHNDSPKSITA